MPRLRKHRALIALAGLAVSAVLATSLSLPAQASVGQAEQGDRHGHYGWQRTVRAGETWVVPRTTRLSRLTIEPGGSVVAPDGFSLTLTVNGVETGQAISETGGTDTLLLPGTYRGRVVLTVAEANPWSGRD